MKQHKEKFKWNEPWEYSNASNKIAKCVEGQAVENQKVAMSQSINWWQKEQGKQSKASFHFVRLCVGKIDKNPSSGSRILA